MSRVAKNPVKLPAGVEIKMSGQQLSVKGAKGALELNVHPSVSPVVTVISRLAPWPVLPVLWSTTW